MKRHFIANIPVLLAVIISIMVVSCKSGFLDAKPNSSIVNPTTLDEFQKLLENADVLNRATPALLQMASDDYVFTDYQSWLATNYAAERNSYIWEKDIYAGETDIRDWRYPYRAIFYCNNVLDGLDNIAPAGAQQERWNNLRGWALFARAFNYYDLIRSFSPPYDPESAATDLGVPLKVTSGIDLQMPRANVQQVYDLIFADLNKARGLLQRDVQPSNRNRPSTAAAYALLSRICLSMRNYERAEAYADSTLMLYNKLIDYNTVDTISTTPFSANNEETIYSASIFDKYAISCPYSTTALVSLNPVLLSSYTSGDLRFRIFFNKNSNGGYYLKRHYSGTKPLPFTGLATDEIYLIKAECMARRNEPGLSMDFLNQLLVTRFKPGYFVPATAANSQSAISKVLEERRKELVWRTIRWDDLRRLNKEGAGIVLKRELNGQDYILAPNDPRYVFPIPDEEITYSNIIQNPR